MRLGLGLTLSGGGLPAFYPDATLALDFVAGAYRVGAGGYSRPDFASLPGLTVSRASVGYAERQDGTLVQFGNNVARITDKGLLVEESRTNLLVQSNAFTTTWLLPNATATSGQGAGPDGTNSLWLITGTSGQISRVQQGITAAAATYTLTAWVAQPATAAAPDAQLVIHDGTYANRAGYTFNLQTRAFTSVQSGTGYTSVSAGIVSQYGSLYRVQVVVTLPAASVQVSIGPSQADGNVNNTGQSILLFGAQLEQASFALSYVPTTSASATRAADVPSVGGLNIASPFTVVAGANSPNTLAANFPTVYQFDDGTTNNVVLAYNNAAANSLHQKITIGASLLFDAQVAASSPAIFAESARVQASNYSGAANGSAAVGESASASVVPTLTTLRLGTTNSANWLNGYIRKVLIYPTAFSDAQLQAATQ